MGGPSEGDVMLPDVNAQKARWRASVNRNTLASLDLEKEQRADSVAGINAIDRTSAPRSGYLGERSYLTGIQHEADAAKLRSELDPKSGEYGMAHSYAGTNFANSPAMSGLRRVASGDDGEPAETDNLNYYGRLAAVQNAQTQGQRARQVAFDESVANDPTFVNRRGDIAREQAVKDARATGDAESAKYAGEEPMRRDQDWERRALERDQGYSDPKIQAAEIAARAKVADTMADRQRERSQAMKSFADLAKQAGGIQPELEERVPGSGWLGSDWMAKKQKRPNPQWEAIQEAMDVARRQIGAGGPDVEQGRAGSVEGVNDEDIAAYAQQEGISLDQARSVAQAWASRRAGGR